jgi:hypothetical protein
MPAPHDGADGLWRQSNASDGRGRLRRGEVQLWVIVHGADPGLLKDSREVVPGPCWNKQRADELCRNIYVFLGDLVMICHNCCVLGKILASISVVTCGPALGGQRVDEATPDHGRVHCDGFGNGSLRGRRRGPEACGEDVAIEPDDLAAVE